MVKTKTYKVRTPRSYRCSGDEYEAAPTAMVIGGRLVQFIAHPMGGDCCRAVFPVNDTTVLKVQVVDECGDWAANQNILECDAWDMVKDTHRANRFCATWGYQEIQVPVKDEDWPITISWCFQERLGGEQLSNDCGEADVAAFLRLGEWVERRFHKGLDDWRTRQVRYVKGNKGHWKVHDYAELASEESDIHSSSCW